MSIMDFTGKHILVLGAGISGQAASLALARHGGSVVLNDKKNIDTSEKPWPELAAAGVQLVFGSQDMGLLEGVDIVVPSPVISPEMPLVAEALRRGLPVWSEVEVACRLTNAEILGVTGTNGKTTTTTLLGEMMKASGRQTVVGGNIGAGLSELAEDLPATAVVVAELSSFQLELTQTLKPKAAVILNITPDHLDRHHTMEAYAAAKERIFRNQDSHDFAALNYDDARVRAMADRMKGHILWFSTEREVPEGAFYDGTSLILRLHGADTVICRDRDLHLFGRHNIQNCLAASLLAHAAGVSLDVIRKVLMSFKGVEHRLEKVRVIHGVTYYNDSKGTNTDASIKALEAFSGHLILIAGGYDKMTPLDEFMALAAKKVDTLILIGNAADRFEEAAKKAGITDIRRAGYSMEQAIMMARKIAKAPQAVLLSPACSSYDMYDNYEQRGRVFKGIVNAI
ncbi:UDP-N-acetylmuramoyl-L-alanine--D-glutamate ligase [uncultured Megasphaera sp.]|uniref:UDP-N-acetylmuramoyl-L-alanine--D-glutamate ligase n=1 Tax=uncultured Megasphaera sp. TaxID=165188 RepID=UPI002659E0D1|nr:UDP-N-acetylmuramoyl-L-alanine--D-glutamate ligase [uncultured Megasphaera sp.]